MTVKERDEIVFKFLSALYDEDETVFLRLIDDKKRGDGYYPKNKEVKLKDLKSMLPDLRTYNTDGYAVHFIVNGGGHQDKDVKVARCQFMECDDLPLAEQYRQIEAFPLKPSFLIQTSKSVHCYWKLKDGNIKRFRDIQERLAAYFNGDPVVKNESRCMRLPTFNHCKKAPVEVKLVEFHPDRIYSQDDLEALLPEINETKAKAQERFELPEVIDKGRRQNTLMRYCCQLWQQGYTESECRQKVKDVNETRCKVPLSEAELESGVWPVFRTYKQGEFLNRFHKFNKSGQAVGIYDDYIIDYIITHEHIFTSNGRAYVYRDGVYKCDERGTMTKALIEKLIFPHLRTINLIDRVYKYLIAKDQLQRDRTETNLQPKWMVNFRNGMLNAKTMELVEHDPSYYSLNQIPHDYIPIKDATGKTPERFIKGLIPDDADRKMFYQFVGLMFTTDTSLQKFLTLQGEGHTGKSTVLRMIEIALGSDNYSSVKLQDLNQRFFPTSLLNKLANICADIPSTIMDQVDQIKMVVGEDDIVGEYKGIDSFKFRSYAKLMFSANKMPKTYEDENGAYYRRLLIIGIPKRGPYIKDLEEMLANEIESFISMCMVGLHSVHTEGFQESENSKAAVLKLRVDTDSVEGFLRDVCVRDPRARANRAGVYRKYADYCFYTGRQAKSKLNLFSSLRNKGFGEVKNQGDWYISGMYVDEEKLGQFSTDEAEYNYDHVYFVDKNDEAV